MRRAGRSRKVGLLKAKRLPGMHLKGQAEGPGPWEGAGFRIGTTQEAPKAPQSLPDASLHVPGECPSALPVGCAVSAGEALPVAFYPITRVGSGYAACAVRAAVHSLRSSSANPDVEFGDETLTVVSEVLWGRQWPLYRARALDQLLSCFPGWEGP